MERFTEKAIAIIKSIPFGKVMTYGQIAAYAGSPRGARQVVRILHSMSSKHDLPWHRVVNSEGKIGFKDEGQYNHQQHLLLSEGVLLNEKGKIDLELYLHQPFTTAEEL
ncbi:MGMT family protein [Rossellomorea aquimaris]|nr:MGMT family protein [Rossellomorea aquimaris]